MSKIVFVGDVHGNFETANRVIADAITQHPEISKIIQVGDLGDGWPMLQGLDRWEPEAHGIPIHWIDGNHDNHAAIAAGKLNSKLIYQKRGSTLKIEDKNFLFCGGAESIDKMYRTEELSWWPEERINKSTFDAIFDLNETIDIVVTHDRPFLVEGEDVCGIYERKGFVEVLECFKPKFWFYGHWHKSSLRKIGDTYAFCCPDIHPMKTQYFVFDTKTNEVWLGEVGRNKCLLLNANV